MFKETPILGPDVRNAYFVNFHRNASWFVELVGGVES